MTMAKRVKSSLLNQRQDVYVEARADGKSKREAAKIAGYSENSAREIEKASEVKKSLLAMREELSSATQFTRAEVLTWFKEAYDMAKIQSEPTAMVSAAKEVGRMLGYYEPETIKLQLSQSQSSFQSKLLVMPDHELLALAQGTGTIVNGEFVRVN